MAARIALVICSLFVILYFGLSQSAPIEDISGGNGKGDLIERFAEFLQQDKELSAVLGKASFTNEAHLIRNRRANDVDDVESVDSTTLDTNTAGFFDRAAHFVMEVLQRFLRWVNTDK